LAFRLSGLSFKGPREEDLIVVYATFKVGAPDRAAFEEWFMPLVKIAQAEEGCIAYDYSVNPECPDRGSLIEVWASQEAFDAHAIHPGHVEMIALGAMVWNMHDGRNLVWRDAQGYLDRPSVYPGESATGELNRLLVEFEEAYVRDNPGYSGKRMYTLKG